MQSFTFPPDVGYALDSRYYLMETHYSDMEPPKDLESLHAIPADNSGLRLYYTSALRKHDAGVLSIGKLSPNCIPVMLIQCFVSIMIVCALFTFGALSFLWLNVNHLFTDAKIFIDINYKVLNVHWYLFAFARRVHENSEYRIPRHFEKKLNFPEITISNQ